MMLRAIPQAAQQMSSTAAPRNEGQPTSPAGTPGIGRCGPRCAVWRAACIHEASRGSVSEGDATAESSEAQDRDQDPQDVKQGCLQISSGRPVEQDQQSEGLVEQ